MQKARLGIIVVVLVAVAAVIIWQQQRAARLQAEVATLRQQVAQAASLQDEVARLQGQLQAAAERSAAETRELARLRGQAARLRQTEQEIASLTAERDRLAQQQREPAPPPPQEDPFDRQHGPGSGARVNAARHWGFALLNYAANHQGQFPANLQQAAPFLHDQLSAEDKAQALQSLGQFEMVYHGLRDDLSALPPESTIILREKQAWMDQAGQWCKTYCMSDGGATLRSSRENDFAQWENLRIPRPAGE